MVGFYKRVSANYSWLLILPFPLLTSLLNLLFSQGKIKHEEKGLFSIIIIYSQAV